MKFTLSTVLALAAFTKAAEVTLFTGLDCDPANKIGDTLTVADESGNNADANFKDDNQKPTSMLVIGWATVLLKKNTNDIFDQPTCAYCANYYTKNVGTVDDGCHPDDGQKCVNIDTGFGIGHVKLIAEGSPSPADIPCRNHLNQCGFPVPPGNGFCDQSH
ncbi:uncharacterized protein N0V89_010446 [Didymosphaeria variabile]|uniref:Uncharacterized protein n=1 Tax=Didymosphaeria variabile TaxID=1932322 RepID=A0A9W8XDB5_9PLEO|nr:uncharacterized protein N0V89_010446 [Didymosphaeria variabile]KAJ4346516.1 hypothetical protein N0V89_010446 [Didymosphaeria variabile]